MRRLLLIPLLLFFLFMAGSGSSTRADDWPQWLGPQRDGVWREKGILDKFPDGGPKVLWRTTIGGGYAGPAVAGGKVYVTDRVLDPGVSNPDNPFNRKVVKGKERILCLDQKTGNIIWKHEYECPYSVSYPVGPRTTPVVMEGKVWALGTMGNLFCLDAGTGKVIWSRDFVKDYNARVPLWGFSAHLLLDGKNIISLVGGEGSVVVAFDKDTGKERWKALSLTTAEIGYCPPMIFQASGKRQLIIWHPESVNGLDPETGKVYWSEPFAVKQNLTIPTPRVQGDRLFVSCFYNGSMMLKFKPDAPGVTVVWKGKQWKPKRASETPANTDGLHCIMSTPLFQGDSIYGVCSYGELRCLKADTGERVWQTLKATGAKDKPVERWANAFLVTHGERTFLFNEKGDLIIAKLTPKGYDEISRAHILDATGQLSDRKVVWTHPAFADKCVFARNDKEIVCVSLAK